MPPPEDRLPTDVGAAASLADVSPAEASVADAVPNDYEGALRPAFEQLLGLAAEQADRAGDSDEAKARAGAALEAATKLGIRPLFIECHRLNPFSFRATDVGVVLDLMAWHPALVATPLGMTALGALAGLLPAFKAYSTDVASNLVPAG